MVETDEQLEIQTSPTETSIADPSGSRTVVLREANPGTDTQAQTTVRSTDALTCREVS